MDDFSLAETINPETTFHLPTLYRVAADGKVWAWSVAFDGSKLIFAWETLDKYQQGLVQVSSRTIETNSRSISLYHQALQEAQAEYKNKIDKSGYSDKIIQKDLFNISAMLCTKWDPNKKQIRRWPVIVQPKLDGCRCRIHLTDQVYLISRATQPIHHLLHIREHYQILDRYIKNIIQQWYPGMSDVCRVDGELYSDQLSFDMISGITRLVHQPSQHERLVKYYLFDLILSFDLPYEGRYNILHTAYQMYQSTNSDIIQLVNSSVANSPQEILAAHDLYVSQGYEGVIIRKFGGTTPAQIAESYYKGSRCTAIYKYKIFQDTEGYIVGAEYVNGGHGNGAVVWVVQDVNGLQFKVNPKGDVETRIRTYQEYIANPNLYLGHKYRYKYQELTSDGKPRFPIGLGFVYDR